MRKTTITIMIAFIAGLGGSWVYEEFIKETEIQPSYISSQTDYGNYAVYNSEKAVRADASEDFVSASATTTPSVTKLTDVPGFSPEQLLGREKE